MKRFKIVIVGDSGTGKTSLLTRLKKDQFDIEKTSTSITNNGTYNFHIDYLFIEADIWDLGGGRDDLPNVSFYDVDGIFLVYDITNATSFDNITGWLKDITPLVGPKTIIKLIGNKTDLQDQRTVSIEKIQLFTTDHGLTFTETSALNASNVIMTFESMIQELCNTANNSDGSTDTYMEDDVKDLIDVSCNETQQPQERLFKDLAGLSFNDTEQQQQKPFHIVLVDLRKASFRYRPIIRCIEMPLSEANQKYVAISYRWGELQETIIDTHLDYTATITSFDINDFYQLCRTITKEKGMQDLDYVWVDAICINQTNHEQRKATIYQMTNIYEHAHSILAVPDLHKAHLENISTLHSDIMNSTHHSSKLYQKDIYYLIHGHTDQCHEMDEAWLDQFKVPTDPRLRRLLQSSTNYLTDSFMTHRLHHSNYNAIESLDHIYETSTTTRQQVYGSGPEYLDHDCNDPQTCPLDLYHRHRPLPDWKQHTTYNNERSWKQLVQKRGASIQHSMKYMADLIKDWSSRVWVISEYNIAKKKNNLKYWFIQLGDIDDDIEDFTFFQFSFDNASFFTEIQQAFKYDADPDPSDNDPVYLTFHKTMLNQLDQQSFFEMMLKSKASKHEDRFYAIFPQTEYKSMVTDKAQVDSWNINTLTMVKLKLYEIMTIKDKLNLLYISANLSSKNLGEILPTFASSTINWNILMDHFYTPSHECNFDFNDPSTITLCPMDDNNSFYLNVKPKEYFIQFIRSGRTFKKSPKIWDHLLPDEGPNCTLCIPSMTSTVMESNDKNETGEYIDWDDHVVYLIGHYEENIWTIIRGLPLNFHVPFAPTFSGFEHCTSEDNHVGFNIY